MLADGSAERIALSADRSRDVGARLRDARLRADMTQESLAQASGVAVRHIQRIEVGAGNPTIGTLYALTDALGVDVRQVLPEPDRPA